MTLAYCRLCRIDIRAPEGCASCTKLRKLLTFHGVEPIEEDINPLELHKDQLRMLKRLHARLDAEVQGLASGGTSKSKLETSGRLGELVSKANIIAQAIKHCSQEYRQSSKELKGLASATNFDDKVRALRSWLEQLPDDRAIQIIQALTADFNDRRRKAEAV
jgi:hypothetical protein